MWASDEIRSIRWIMDTHVVSFTNLGLDNWVTQMRGQLFPGFTFSFFLLLSPSKKISAKSLDACHHQMLPNCNRVLLDKM